MQDWQREQVDDRRKAEIFRRVHRLVKRGYTPDWRITDVEDAIRFDHPGKGPGLILYPDGLLVARMESAKLDPTARDDPHAIGNREMHDAAIFDRWLATVPLPTWRERTRADRERFLYQPGCLVLFVLVSLAVGKALEWGWHQIFG